MAQQNLAFVFPGQGSQKIGMLAEAAERFPEIKSTFEQASEVLGYDLWGLLQNGEQAHINLTETTQPLLLVSGVALWRAWLANGGEKPAMMAGHSLGEFTALVCAGVIDFADAVALVQQRGRFMQTAVPVGEGAMAAVLGLADEVVLEVCQSLSEQGVVEAVNFNAPGQVVIAGHVAAVEAAIVALKAKGAKKAMPLPVSAPFHTSLMKVAGEQLKQAMQAMSFTKPEIPVVHNVGAVVLSEPEQIKAILVEQISAPVQWVDCVQALADAGADTVLECGPGKVLSGLNKRIVKGLTLASLEQSDVLLSYVKAAAE